MFNQNHTQIIIDIVDLDSDIYKSFAMIKVNGDMMPPKYIQDTLSWSVTRDVDVESLEYTGKQVLEVSFKGTYDWINGVTTE
jgi:hypothetical protein